MRPAQPHETAAVIAFYHTLITENSASPYHPDWRVNIYPTDEMIETYVRTGNLYLLDAPEGGICGAFALSGEPGDGYEAVPWRVNVPWSDAVVVHLLGIAHDHQRRGLGTKMVGELLDLCRSLGKKAVRLDVMLKNLPAQKLYTRAGFQMVGRCALWYEDTGTLEFYMYEYDLTRETPSV